MKKHFKKKEVIKLLGKVIQFKKDWKRKYKGVVIDWVKAGDLHLVDLIRYNNGNIEIILVDLKEPIEIREFNNTEFNKYCQLLQI